ncbi:MAG: acetyl-CoA acetyltransferase [Rhodobacterales bacterium 65-51]|uniref:thiolase family protein n=1 Tax=uncultured Gemmobacter sp. TaxID=1095917 RepID=UPI0009613F2F|nr:thiolase family protein [uncultured Gemmobacter sp.]OJY27530.1 MAG: acetyl-CoA acetyltransferase [Rhodobacterales bacterium 65-51]
MTEPRLIAARRSPVMPRGGAFAGLALHELAAPVIAAVLKDAGIALDQVDELILSNALGAGGNPARLAALAAGLPERVAGLSVDRQCAGGLDAIGIAAALVASGQARVVLAGGVESYSRRPLRLAQAPGQTPQPYDRPPFTPWPDRDPDMTDAAAALADRLGISAARQQAWAVRSHTLARASAQPEIVPVAGQDRDGFTRTLTPALAARAPRLAGSVNAATTAVEADGAAFALVVAPDIAAKARRSLRIRACATLGAAPEEPGLAPVAAIRRVLDRTGLAPDALEQIELMEAYAVQALACMDACALPEKRVNPGGGALARGHPIGASGAILVARLFHGLQHGSGLAAIAAAGGIGSALVLQI